jgi:hypothetical protein
VPAIIAEPISLNSCVPLLAPVVDFAGDLYICPRKKGRELVLLFRPGEDAFIIVWRCVGLLLAVLVAFILEADERFLDKP